MGNFSLKLKQASAALGVPAKDLQNLVQLKVIKPIRRGNLYWFDANLLIQAKVAFYLKQSLGSSSDLLARFTEALSKNIDTLQMQNKYVWLRSRPMNGAEPVEIKIPIHSLAVEIGYRLPQVYPSKKYRKRRSRAEWKKDFVRTMQKAAIALGDISEEEILRTIREYRAERKKMPEISIVARSKKKTA